MKSNDNKRAIIVGIFIFLGIAIFIITILTLGLFLFVVNALVVLLASRFVNGISIANFWWGLLFSLLLSIITSVLDRELKKDRKLRF